MLNKLDFINVFSQKCKNNTAALFLGAGISINAGLPSWKQLFEPLASKLKIDIDNTNYQNYDIAQFYANTFGLNSLYREINSSINSLFESSETLDHLCNIQCNSYWTTNFDKVLEKNLENKGKIINVISKESDLVTCDLNRRTNIFKMNGDISDLQSAIITRDDLEKYYDNHAFLVSCFKRELITRTFLFIGYSFTDTLVLQCVSELSRAFNNKQPHHYTILKRSKSSEFNKFVEDLEKRYQIDVVLIDDYYELIEIFKSINFYTNQRNIMISGAYYDKKDLINVDNLCKALAKTLYKNQLTIINGYGTKVGYYIASEMTKIMLEDNVVDFQRHLLMYPFDENSSKQDKTKHRRFMISKSNVVIFMFGVAASTSGMMEEFEIAKNLNKTIIPIASTGGAAKLIFDEVKTNIINYPYLEKYLEKLEKEKDVDLIAKTVLSIIKEDLEKSA